MKCKMHSFVNRASEAEFRSPWKYTGARELSVALAAGVDDPAESEARSVRTARVRERVHPATAAVDERAANEPPAALLPERRGCGRLRAAHRCRRPEPAFDDVDRPARRAGPVLRASRAAGRVPGPPAPVPRVGAGGN